MKILVLFLLVACAVDPVVHKTERSMLAWRLTHSICKRTCPVGQYLAPTTPEAEDCCDDPYGLMWATCAWNVEGRYMTYEQLTRPRRLAGGCGTDGFPDCK